MPTVDTRDGRLAGAERAHGFAFLGIPYAAAARWAPPAAPTAWPGVRDATRRGPVSPQAERGAGTYTHGPTPEADERRCLNLNVYTPSLSGARPVLVWIHGGGFAVGFGSASVYDGAYLAAVSDLVVVTLNYRLGTLGWLGHPALATDTEAPVANWGLQDQIAALRWVRANIAEFGGDPERVILAGQSAGALSAMDLLVAPAAHGLFRRVALHSPVLVDAGHPMELGVRWGEAISASLGLGNFIPDALRALDPAEIIQAQESLVDAPEFRRTRGGALPLIDPVVLPRSPLEDPGASPEVDVLVGSTAHEGTFFFDSPWRGAPTNEQIPTIVGMLTGGTQGALETERERARAEGRGTDDLSLLVDIATESLVVGPMSRWAQARARLVGDRSAVFRFRVDHEGGGPQLRATHSVDAPLLFGTCHDGDVGERLGGGAEGGDAVSAEMQRVWGAFAHGSRPGWAAIGARADAQDVGIFGGARPFHVERLGNDRSLSAHSC